jgi:histidyl-tRNA synthetase
VDVEVLGSENGRIDAEMMALVALFFEEIGVNVSLELNTLGCPECRPGFRRELLAFLQSKQAELCEDCRRRMTTNPLRVLDCKNARCRELVEEAPSIQDHLCAVCSDHFEVVKASLEKLGIGYALNKFMVRGLDYYCRTTFEFLTTDLGSQAAVCAGGRYDGLVEQLGGPKIPGIGFAMGLERLVLLLQQKEDSDGETPVDLFIAGLGPGPSEFSYILSHQLRRRGLKVAMDHEGRSLKSQMKQADKACALFALIIGDQELDNRAGLLRNMQTQEQLSVELQEEEIEAIVSSLLPHR